MQSEKFDNKIKEAAGHHHPAYDEKAWAKMERLLDKHLPQKKDNRRRFIFFLLLFLLLGGSSAWLLISKPWEKSKSIAGVKQEIKQLNPVIPSETSTPDKNESITQPLNKVSKEATNNITDNGNNKEVPAIAVEKEFKNETTVDFNERGKKTTAFIISAANKKRNSKNNPAVFKINDSKLRQSDRKIENDQQKKIKEGTVKTVVINPVGTNSGNKLSEPELNSDASIINNTKKDINKPNNNSEAIDIKNEPVKQTPKSKKAKSKNSFFFTLSAGPDISAAGSDKLGKLKLLAGAGLGYTFKDRITIRTGFYTSKKIYSASPDKYHPPADFRTYYPYLEKVDANCKVYEIPLSLSYSFGKSSKQNWFAAAGLSSYLMKKEVYNYFYKQTLWGQTLNRKWTIDNKNKHYFSVFTLSGGYQRSMSKNISVMIEPYVKLPLSGVGYGKVKLNSGGILFSVGIKPFTVMKKKQR